VTTRRHTDEQLISGGRERLALYGNQSMRLQCAIVAGLMLDRSHGRRLDAPDPDREDRQQQNRCAGRQHGRHVTTHFRR
jgi:hypothetical protein